MSSSSSPSPASSRAVVIPVPTTGHDAKPPNPFLVISQPRAGWADMGLLVRSLKLTFVVSKLSTRMLRMFFSPGAARMT